MAASASWTAERIHALAPDPAAARAGQNLAAARHWTSLGESADLLWGECRGSGSRPYQVKVARDGPAFSCSCPSRKFPCKHALGLLLIAADSVAPLASDDPPAWVAAWVAARVARAEAKRPSGLADATPADPAGKAKREAARLRKVAAGLDDLDRWLGDLVRAGFATLGARPKNFWDEQARRLVDAQCPGVARRLRQVEAMPRAGEGWQAALLDRLGQLHLLIQGFRRLDHLPAEVRDDLKAAIGFPVDFDAVRAGNGGTHVRDTWQVLGQAFALEDKIAVRRTWLAGREGGRSALILDFAAPNRPFDARFEPGTVVAATLGFLPGAAPLRAIPIDQHDAAEPLATLAGGLSIDAAQAAFAAVLARSPWVELVAVILADVRVQPGDEGWSVVDAAGARLPLPRRFDRGWDLEALTGGAPLILAGEFDGSTLNPLGALIGRDYWPLVAPAGKLIAESPVGGPGRWLVPPSPLMDQAAAAATIGVERKGPPIPPRDHPIGPLATSLADRDASRRLLALAAAAGLAARAGRIHRVEAARAAAELAPAETRPECPPAATRRLRRLLDQDEAVRLANAGSRLTFEWFDACDRAGCRLPHDLLVPVLDLLRDQGPPGPAVAAVLGARGRWLVGRNPAWEACRPAGSPEDVALVWRTGRKADRLAALRALRAVDPAEARRIVEPTFAAEPAPTRAEIVALLALAPRLDDEPFLEAALDDRSREVRAAAAKCLPALPGSRLAARMADRARAVLGWDGDLLAVIPPTHRDEAMARDGIITEPPATSGGRVPLGEPAWLVREVLSRTPLDAVEAHLGRPPEALVAATLASGRGPVVREAWEVAAIKQAHPRWSEALARARVAADDLAYCPRISTLFAAIPVGARHELIAAVLDRSSRPIRATDAVICLIEAERGRFGPELGRRILDRIFDRLRAEQEAASHDWQAYIHPENTWLQGLFGRLDHRLPFELVDEVAARSARELVGQPTPDSPYAFSLAAAFAGMIGCWQFRRAMHEEFAAR